MSIFNKYSIRQVGTVTSKYEKYMGIERRSPEKQHLLSIYEFKNKTMEFYSKLNNDEKEILEDRLVDIVFWLKSKVISQKKINPIIEENYSEFYKTLFNKSFWKVEPKTNVLFDTDSNEDFFNYVMQYFKDDKILYKQRSLSYMYWRMKSIFYSKNALFIRYVNETYNDLKPLKKVLSLSVIEKEPVIEQRNVLFNKAMKNWNEENQVFKKHFDPIDCVV